MKLNKFLIATLLAMCVIGFSMSAVSAKSYTYNINGKVGDVFKFDYADYARYGYSFTAAISAFEKSSLFSEYKYYYQVLSSGGTFYEFTAVNPGSISFKIKEKHWTDPDYYNFNIAE